MRTIPSTNEQKEKKSLSRKLYEILDFKPHWFTWTTVVILLFWLACITLSNESWGKESGLLKKIKFFELLVGGFVTIGAGKAYRSNTKMRRFWFWAAGTWIFTFLLEHCSDWHLFHGWSNSVYGIFCSSFIGLLGFFIVVGLFRNFDLPEILRTVRLPVFDLLILWFVIALSLWFKMEAFPSKTVSSIQWEFGEILIWWSFGTLFFLNSFPPKAKQPTWGERFNEVEEYLERN